ncbi:hypothetical protein IGB42_03008 [Andreprevotia sp. IGB-42]|nr:hypothetical protein IGB42_03008 [Andreprevotia sp. IGB-42]
MLEKMIWILAKNEVHWVLRPVGGNIPLFFVGRFYVNGIVGSF